MNYNIEDISYCITESCPGPCRYCSMWQLPDRQSEELTPAELDSIFSSKYLNLKKVHLTGGEPHLTDNIFNIADSIYKFHDTVVTDTPITGWFPERHVEVAEYFLKKHPLVRLDISLDGDEETNGKIRLRKDGFKLAVKTVEELSKLKGVVLRFQFTIYKENHHLIEWMYNFAKELGVGLYIGYGRYNPTRYRNLKDNLVKEELNENSFIWTDEELATIDRQLLNIGYDKGRYAGKYYFQKAIYERRPVEFDCYMGRRSIDIDPYGNVYPCLLWLNYLKMGNIRTAGGFDKVLEGDQAQEVLTMIESKQCQQDCTFTCATKMTLKNPDIPSVGMIKYPGRYGYIFSELDVIPIRPWWYDEYVQRGII
ncbi:radical SAM protein [Seleniivibrio woodruffii]|uniref:Radical SAM protein with 4Fe4S-binding SPASM domain n=1 Tax=Seleniivibrio woodruffii TaxID=1078050 RepID=A0A4R1KAX2_9BACT|nr:radical SAM protein [Seleniivibrio woodruffii]TCK61678.1 radical SAM protein with 4Fe4S-binding SPASM domain [Seleniivibrio woodruffii]TVZ35207.1 radical SAM protein with 4Fe4S-binding SPASM domain [Seleniivibrio woodruffii]